MDEMAAIQEALRNLREDINASEARLRDQINRHSDDDTAKFSAINRAIDDRFSTVTKAIEDLNLALAQWTGALSLLKWTGGICMPLILGAVLTHLIRHWNQ
jgi:hypothetical protein